MFGDLIYLQTLDTSEENCKISSPSKILSLWTFFAVEVDGSDVTVGTPECLNIQTRHKFENFCLFSLNITYSIQNQV